MSKIEVEIDMDNAQSEDGDIFEEIHVEVTYLLKYSTFNLY